MTIALTILLWTLWCAGHSLPITPASSTFFQRQMGERYTCFRLGYNLFALVTFVPLALWTHGQGGAVLLRWEGPWIFLQALLWMGAGGLFWAGARVYPLEEFLGIRSCREGRLSPPSRFRRGGVLEFVRHPWYLAAFLLIWGRDLRPGEGAASIILTLYLLIGGRLEEKKLEREFKEEYRRYKEEVSMILPWRWARHRWQSLRRKR